MQVFYGNQIMSSFQAGLGQWGVAWGFAWAHLDPVIPDGESAMLPSIMDLCCWPRCPRRPVYVDPANTRQHSNVPAAQRAPPHMFCQRLFSRIASMLSFVTDALEVWGVGGHRQPLSPLSDVCCYI